MNPENPENPNASSLTDLEVRIVASILGESSEFEDAQIESLCKDQARVDQIREQLRGVDQLIASAKILNALDQMVSEEQAVEDPSSSETVQMQRMIARVLAKLSPEEEIEPFRLGEDRRRRILALCEPDGGAATKSTQGAVTASTKVSSKRSSFLLRLLDQLDRRLPFDLKGHLKNRRTIRFAAAFSLVLIVAALISGRPLQLARVTSAVPADSSRFFGFADDAAMESAWMSAPTAAATAAPMDAIDRNDPFAGEKEMSDQSVGMDIDMDMEMSGEMGVEFGAEAEEMAFEDLSGNLGLGEQATLPPPSAPGSGAEFAGQVANGRASLREAGQAGEAQQAAERPQEELSEGRRLSLGDGDESDDMFGGAMGGVGGGGLGGGGMGGGLGTRGPAGRMGRGGFGGGGSGLGNTNGVDAPTSARATRGESVFDQRSSGGESPPTPSVPSQESNAPSSSIGFQSQGFAGNQIADESVISGGRTTRKTAPDSALSSKGVRGRAPAEQQSQPATVDRFSQSARKQLNNESLDVGGLEHNGDGLIDSEINLERESLSRDLNEKLESAESELRFKKSEMVDKVEDFADLGQSLDAGIDKAKNLPQLNQQQGQKDNKEMESAFVEKSKEPASRSLGKSLPKRQAGAARSRLSGKLQSVDEELAEVEEKELLQDQQLEAKQVEEAFREISAEQNAFSTFSLHVSDVSFKLAKAAFLQGQWPDASRIRIEEFVNAMDYGDPMPTQRERVSCRVEQAIHPFLQQRNLIRVSMRTAASGRSNATALKLTFLLDNSGSMERLDRKYTVRRAFQVLAAQLQEQDEVTLISFANQPRLIADRLPGKQAAEIMQLLDRMPSEGGTNLEAALLLAAEKAREQYEPAAQNRIVLITDGAVNLGDANPDRLSKMIVAMRDSGIAFDAAGIGSDGLNDEVLETLTRRGDGRYYMLDSQEAVEDGFAKQIAGALRPAAKNVKVQVEFNPQRVGMYKLLGFEKHRLKKEDFRNDKVDAAEMAAAEAGVAVYQVQVKPDGFGDLGSVAVRFQDIASGRMVEERWPITFDANTPRIDQSSSSMKIATVASLFALKLKGGERAGTVDLRLLREMIASLPESLLNNTRVRELWQMIDQARQNETPLP